VTPGISDNLNKRNEHDPVLETALLAALLATSGPVLADAGHGHTSKIGSPAVAREATRTIEVDMTDNRYSLSEIDVAKGEAIRFVIHNRG
jgi:uncharacterized cupredoxin-like copper-binding protein